MCFCEWSLAKQRNLFLARSLWFTRMGMNQSKTGDVTACEVYEIILLELGKVSSAFSKMIVYNCQACSLRRRW